MVSSFTHNKGHIVVPVYETGQTLSKLKFTNLILFEDYHRISRFVFDFPKVSPVPVRIIFASKFF